jgi:hypothetical protein
MADLLACLSSPKKLIKLPKSLIVEFVGYTGRSSAGELD